jgi:putative membrane protein
MGWMWLVLILLAGVAYWIYSAAFAPRRRRWMGEDPMEAARMRLARGEITAEEFEEIRKNLQL